MNKRGRAKHLLRFYLFKVAQNGYKTFDPDSIAEINELVDCLIDAAKEELQAEETQSEIEENLFHRF